MIEASVVIPTHNRSSILFGTLEALSHQTYPADRFEVIVVANGCTDDTLEMAGKLVMPYRLVSHEVAKAGASQARNTGAQLASSSLLIFLDDDISAAPGLVEAHVRAHGKDRKQVVIGYLPAMLSNPRDYFHLELLGWWEAMFEVMRAPGHRFTYNDLLSGNFSIQKEFFDNIGGFDPAYLVHEDYELGLRLVEAGALFVFEANAWGHHYEHTDLERALRRKYQEGIADVLLAHAYPEIISRLLMVRLLKYSLLPSRILRVLAFKLPRLGDTLVEWCVQVLPSLERIHLLGLWRRILYGLLGYWYWKGVAKETGSMKAMKLLLARQPTPIMDGGQADLKVDLSLGVEYAEQLLNQYRPASVLDYYGGHFVGLIQPQPGAERLRGEHLRPILVNDLALPLLKALMLAGVPGAQIPSEVDGELRA